VFLCLPIIENVDAIGVKCVIGSTDGLSGVNAIPAVVACDPRARDGTAIVAEPKRA
jgi:hypothetical protein